MVRIDADVPGIDAFLDEGDSFDGDSFGGDPFGGDSFSSDPFGGGGFDAFGALFVIIPLLMVGAVVLMIVLAVLNARRLRSKGISPLATEAEIVADAVRSSAAQRPAARPTAGPAQTVEARLAEIDRLHAAGKITVAERDAARAKVLGTL